MSTSTTVNGGISFWSSAIGLPEPRPALDGDLEVDVAIVGGGYTGLWTAYYLKQADPTLRIAILERQFCGYGASGRNGGWLYNGFAGRSGFARRYGQPRAVAMQQAMNESVDEVLRVCASEGIEADQVKGGVLEVARTPAQVERLDAFVEAERAHGAADVRRLSAAEAADRIAVSGVLGAAWSPCAAAVQPAKLVRGLARAVERSGVEIYEQTTVIEIQPAHGPVPARAVTPRGTVRARYALRCTEGFTATLRGEKRTWLPVNSSMIITAPLPAAFWDRVGWEGRETLGDFAHAYMYAQRTADDRIALGGRGVPYRFGSRTDADGSTQPKTIVQLTEILTGFFPAARGVAVEHAWSGVLGVPRDWCSTVALDPSTGLGWAGGYVGSGVTATNLAARTLRDLILGRSTDLTDLPWANHRVRTWEPEPFRWLGVQGMYAAYHFADRRERNGRATTSPVARVADVISGRR